MHGDALRIESGHHLTDHAIFASRVDPLQYHQERTTLVRPEPHLQFVNLGKIFLKARFAVCFAEAAIVIRLPVRKRNLLTRLDREVLEFDGGHHGTVIDRVRLLLCPPDVHHYIAPHLQITPYPLCKSLLEEVSAGLFCLGAHGGITDCLKKFGA